MRTARCNPASCQKQEPTNLTWCITFLASPRRTFIPDTIWDMLYSQKWEESNMISNCSMHWSPMPLGPSWQLNAVKDQFPSSWDRYTVWLARSHMRYVLKQHKEVHCTSQVRESFVLIRKKNPGQSSTWQAQVTDLGDRQERQSVGNGCLPSTASDHSYASLCVDIYFTFSVYLGELLPHILSVYSTPSDLPNCFPKYRCHTIYISSKSVWGF